jgi:hypothetical protein
VASLLLDLLIFCHQFSLPVEFCLVNIFQVGMLGCTQPGLAYSSLCTHASCPVIVLVHLGANPLDLMPCQMMCSKLWVVLFIHFHQLNWHWLCSKFTKMHRFMITLEYSCIIVDADLVSRYTFHLRLYVISSSTTWGCWVFIISTYMWRCWSTHTHYIVSYTCLHSDLIFMSELQPYLYIRSANIYNSLKFFNINS